MYQYTKGIEYACVEVCKEMLWSMKLLDLVVWILLNPVYLHVKIKIFLY